MSEITPDLLRNTVVSRWHRRLTSNQSGRRSHWRTKTIYFRSVADLVARQPEHTLTWRSVVDAAAPLGNRSTFYEVTGGQARHPLIRDLIQDGACDSIQLALCYHRSDAISQLLDETKVWSYWPHRERLLARLAARPMSGSDVEAALVDEVRDWAHRYPRLAATLDAAPPACAAEDLVVIRAGQTAPSRSVKALGDLLRDTAPREVHAFT
ncbi:hypothetical protein ACN27F_31020 [Solwaraspora sp. WMMB335]|uniref:hypothetical protein n=1 Tax=Solwaraspora sp. WMMB335 TaxID=3404118 RepID=UPI003B95BCF2